MLTRDLNEMISAKKDIWKVFKVTKKHEAVLQKRFLQVCQGYNKAEQENKQAFMVAKAIELKPLTKLCELFQLKADQLFTNMAELDIKMMDTWRHKSGLDDLTDILEPEDVNLYVKQLRRKVQLAQETLEELDVQEAILEAVEAALQEAAVDGHEQPN